MKWLIFSLTLLIASVGFACLAPTHGELSAFFEGDTQWTEVQSADSFELASKRPVHLSIDFEQQSNIRILWGEDKILGKDITLCWKSKKRNKLQIRKTFFQVTLIKVKPGLLKSWIPMDGDLYYRKNKQVLGSQSKRQIADQNK